MTEEWRWVPGWEGFYEVSNCGSVRSVDRCITQGSRWGTQVRVMRGKLLKQFLGTSGYLGVALSRPGYSPRTYLVHRLVASAFLGPPPPGMEVCHNDGVRTRNAASNLRWDSRSSNHSDKRDHGTAGIGDRNPMAKLSEDEALLILRSREPGVVLASRHGVSQTTVCNIKKRRTWTHLDPGLPNSTEPARL